MPQIGTEGLTVVNLKQFGPDSRIRHLQPGSQVSKERGKFILRQRRGFRARVESTQQRRNEARFHDARQPGFRKIFEEVSLMRDLPEGRAACASFILNLMFNSWPTDSQGLMQAATASANLAGYQAV